MVASGALVTGGAVELVGAGATVDEPSVEQPATSRAAVIAIDLDRRSDGPGGTIGHDGTGSDGAVRGNRSVEGTLGPWP